MTRTIYYTATTLDGFLADPDNSLAWLLRQDNDPDGPQNYAQFIGGIGAIVMGSTTYDWVRTELASSGQPWPYEQPTWVMTTRQRAGIDGVDIRFASGPLSDVYPDLQRAAGDRDIWVAGGGDLAGQFADAGLLDEVIVSIAPVVLGAGAPLLPRRLDMSLEQTTRSGAFITARYRILGRLLEDRATP